MTQKEQKTAIISGVTGQDGSYLTELLLSLGYYVIGIVRRTSGSSYGRIDHIIGHERFELVEGEVSDSLSVYNIVDKYKPDEIYNLAAQSHVKTSFDQPDYTFQVNTSGPLYFLEAIRRFSPTTRFYQASTSEMFGNNVDIAGDYSSYQDEDTPFAPRSPYAVAKLAAHNLVRIYREAYGIHASAGILFNHDSERRGEEFVTRKITKWLGRFQSWRHNLPSNLTFGYGDIDNIDHASGSKFPKLRLGNIESSRDFGYAPDYVEGMHLMLQQDTPDDYVLATGESHTIREFLQEAFNEAEIGNFEDCIVIDPKFYRPTEVDVLLGVAYHAKDMLGWEPKVTFKQLVKRMVRGDTHGEKEETQQKEGQKTV